MKKLFSCLLAFWVLMAAGCTGDTSDLPEPSWEEYQQSQQPQPDAPESPAQPQIFALAYHKDHTLDPITCGEGIQQDVSSLLYEPLFQLDQTFQPIPLLCESFAWNDSGLVCTLTIRQGVLFSDGTELTAADVTASLRRAASSDKYGYRLREMVSVSANRSGNVVITLTAPNSGFLSLLNIPIVKSGTEKQLVPTGTGPYLFVTGSEGSVLQANPDWWQQKELPVSTISLIHAKDVDTAVYLFSSRRISLLAVDPTGDQVSPSGQSEETEQDTTNFQFIGFNTVNGVFSNSAARRAFSQGLQRDMLVDVFLSGHGQAAQFPISPSSSLYPTDLEWVYSYEETLQSLDGAGCNSGNITELTLLVNEEDPSRLASARYIAENLSLGDWAIAVKALPWEEYLLALESGEFDLYYGEVRLTADWDLRQLLGTDGTLNYGGISDARLNTLLSQFLNAEDRPAAAISLCSHLQNTAPIAPICFRSNVVLTHPGVVEHLSTTPGSVFSQLSNWSIHLQS